MAGWISSKLKAAETLLQQVFSWFLKNASSSTIVIIRSNVFHFLSLLLISLGFQWNSLRLLPENVGKIFCTSTLLF